MLFTIEIEGATPDEITRGLIAAQEVFDAAGVTALRAAEAQFAVEGWDIGGFEGYIDPDDLALVHVWDNADSAALEACCEGWPEERRPKRARLQLVYKDDDAEESGFD